jgi:hypothetical protein
MPASTAKNHRSRPVIRRLRRLDSVGTGLHSGQLPKSRATPRGTTITGQLESSIR